MGSEKRPKFQAYVPPTPGPGSYTPAKGIGAEGPKYTALSRAST